jgi:hypothetical protein
MVGPILALGRGGATPSGMGAIAAVVFLLGVFGAVAGIDALHAHLARRCRHAEPLGVGAIGPYRTPAPRPARDLDDTGAALDPDAADAPLPFALLIAVALTSALTFLGVFDDVWR